MKNIAEKLNNLTDKQKEEIITKLQEIDSARQKLEYLYLSTHVWITDNIDLSAALIDKNEMKGHINEMVELIKG